MQRDSECPRPHTREHDHYLRSGGSFHPLRTGDPTEGPQIAPEPSPPEGAQVHTHEPPTQAGSCSPFNVQGPRGPPSPSMVLRPRRWLEEHLTPSGTTASRQGPQLCLGSPSCPPLTPSSGKASRPLTARPRHVPRCHPHPRLRFLHEARTLLSGPLWRSLAHLHSSRPMWRCPPRTAGLGRQGPGPAGCFVPTQPWAQHGADARPARGGGTLNGPALAPSP